MKHIPIKNLDQVDASKTVCDLKWNYPLFNFGRNEFRNCCRSPGNSVSDVELDTLGINAFVNHPREIQQRLDLIKGIRIDDCKTCWGLEEKGLRSPREPKRFHYYMRRRGFINKNIEYDENNVSKTVETISNINHPALRSNDPYMIELILGNTCDMKCMYCSHHYSSQWATERIKYGEISQTEYDKEFPKPSAKFYETFWQWFHAHGRYSVKRIGIIGGEPLITPEFYDIVEKLILSVNEAKRKEKITFFIVTNLNTPDNYLHKFLQVLPQLQQNFVVEIIVSQESVEQRAEYIRYGLDWKKFDSNIRKLLQVKKQTSFHLSFMTSMNILNITSIYEFIKYYHHLYDEYKQEMGLRQNIINIPEWQSPSLLTTEFAKYIDETIHFMKSKVEHMPILHELYGRYDQYIDFLTSIRNTIINNVEMNKTLCKKFVEWYTIYDKRRNTNLLTIFPEYKTFWEKCVKL